MGVGKVAGSLSFYATDEGKRSCKARLVCQLPANIVPASRALPATGCATRQNPQAHPSEATSFAAEAPGAPMSEVHPLGLSCREGSIERPPMLLSDALRRGGKTDADAPEWRAEAPLVARPAGNPVFPAPELPCPLAPGADETRKTTPARKAPWLRRRPRPGPVEGRGAGPPLPASRPRGRPGRDRPRPWSSTWTGPSSRVLAKCRAGRSSRSSCRSTGRAPVAGTSHRVGGRAALRELGLIVVTTPPFPALTA